MDEKTNGIQPGDTVRLKSGGPAMTVEKFAEGKEGTRQGIIWATCVWFPRYASSASREEFSVVMLEKVVEAK